MAAKMIFVTGGVVSSIGKGITTASLGRVLINRGYRVHALKIDPYINVDAGLMNPFQHGEVFVTNDGAETDLDLGNYERFLGTDLTGSSNLTSGAVYRAVIEKEREGAYLGETVQLIPHITDEIKGRIYGLAEESRAEVLIVEIGGTIGDFETPPFVEAIRQIRTELGPENTLFVHVTLIVQVSPWGEIKTKPTQHSVRALLSLGVQPDVLVCRSPVELPETVRKKIADACGVPLEAVLSSLDVDYIEEVPLLLEKQGLGDLVVRRLRLPERERRGQEWEEMVHRLKNPSNFVKVAIVGKYTAHGDAYVSVKEALKHAGIANDAQVQIKWVESEAVEEADLEATLADVNGILVPGGYGYRGIEGMIRAIRFARERGIPFLGLCLGMQCMVIEFARHVAGLEGANSTEFDPNTPHPVIDLMEHQRRQRNMGATQRLGIYPCVLQDRSTKAFAAYKQTIILERHRHRYEVNNLYRDRLEAHGMIWSGLSPSGDLVEIAELRDHPWMVGSQFHPEFRSKPLDPHPLFVHFIRAALEFAPAKEVSGRS
ncbi:MAG: CTP synthase [Candidatus Poribacteria bacterium]|nr:MAG: CTP synthase [Candidatus Poribacteria bacterium]